LAHQLIIDSLRHAHDLRTRPAPGALLSLVAALAASSCAVGPDFHSPAPPQTSRYTPDPQPGTTVETAGTGGTAQRFLVDRDIPGEWWTLFQSEPLDRLVRQALQDSPTVDAAKAVLRSAQATYASQAGALLVPRLDGGLSGTRESVPGAAFGIPSIASSTFTLFAATLNISYKLDLFGASRRQLEALRAQRDYEKWELEAAKLTLTGNVVTTAITVASLKAQIAAVSDIVASQTRQLRLVERQFAAGAVSKADVLAQRSLLAQTEATLPALEKSLDQAQHRLSVLAGHTPDIIELPGFDLDRLNLPSELPVTVPAQLIRRRPDVQAAEALLHQANAQVGVATANLFPSLTLTGLIGSETTQLHDLLGPGTKAWNAGASLTQPLFHGGELVQKRRAALADLDQAAAQYRQSVLAAMQDVADTLRALEADARDLRAQAAAESSAADSLEITRRQYQAGAVSSVALLVQERLYLQARQARVQAIAARYSDSAALFQALGGGWWNRKE
jgi:NodT family efflux transporter outer membrane factor (OMF) lipoprotein